MDGHMDFVRALMRDGLAYGVRAEEGYFVLYDQTAATARSPDAARRYLALSPPPVHYPVCAPFARSPLDCALWASSRAHGESSEFGRGRLTVNARYLVASGIEFATPGRDRELRVMDAPCDEAKQGVEQ
jgi:hypothetical protein